jgi:hypothetical protein
LLQRLVHLLHSTPERVAGAFESPTRLAAPLLLQRLFHQLHPALNRLLRDFEGTLTLSLRDSARPRPVA